MGRAALVREVAALRVARMRRIPGFRDTMASRRELAAGVGSLLAAARAGGRVEVLRTGGVLRAVLLTGTVEARWSGGTVTQVRAECDLRSPRGRRWMGDALAELLAAPPPDLVLTLSAPYREFLRHVDGAAAHVRCVILMGNPRAARRGLGRVDVAGRLAAAGLAVGPLAAPAEIERVLRWKRAWFRRHPEFGAHCALPACLEAEREEMTAGLTSGDHDMLLLRRRGRPVGYFGFVVSPSASWGRVANLDLQLTPPLHGQGLARVAYSLLVDRMLTRGLDALQGGTSQPGVLHLARVMRRPALGWVLAAGPGHFPVEAFLDPCRGRPRPPG